MPKRSKMFVKCNLQPNVCHQIKWYKTKPYILIVFYPFFILRGQTKTWSGWKHNHCVILSLRSWKQISISWYSYLGMISSSWSLGSDLAWLERKPSRCCLKPNSTFCEYSLIMFRKYSQTFIVNDWTNVWRFW